MKVFLHVLLALIIVMIVLAVTGGGAWSLTHGYLWEAGACCIVLILIALKVLRLWPTLIAMSHEEPKLVDSRWERIAFNVLEPLIMQQFQAPQPARIATQIESVERTIRGNAFCRAVAEQLVSALQQPPDCRANLVDVILLEAFTEQEQQLWQQRHNLPAAATALGISKRKVLVTVHEMQTIVRTIQEFVSAALDEPAREQIDVALLLTAAVRHRKERK